MSLFPTIYEKCRDKLTILAQYKKREWIAREAKYINWLQFEGESNRARDAYEDYCQEVTNERSTDNSR